MKPQEIELERDKERVQPQLDKTRPRVSSNLSLNIAKRGRFVHFKGLASARPFLLLGYNWP